MSDSDLFRGANGIITGRMGHAGSHRDLLRVALAWELIERGGGAHPFLDAAAIQVEPLRLLNDDGASASTLSRMLDALRTCEHSAQLDVGADGEPFLCPLAVVCPA